jgi:hypothetical protein
MLGRLFMLLIYSAFSAVLLWGALDAGDVKWYRGNVGVKRLLLHSLILGAVLSALAPYLAGMLP